MTTTTSDSFQEAGKLMGWAMERRKDKPKEAILSYMNDALEGSKLGNYEPNWKEMLKEVRTLWRDNL